MDQSELRTLSPVSSFHFLQNLDPIRLTVVADMSLWIITKMILMVVKALFGSEQSLMLMLLCVVLMLEMTAGSFD